MFRGWNVKGTVLPPENPPKEVIDYIIKIAETVVMVDNMNSGSETSLSDSETANLPSEIGLRIRQIRINRGISQRHVQQQLNKYKTWLSQVESGAIRLYAEDIKPLAEVLGVKVADIIG